MQLTKPGSQADDLLMFGDAPLTLDQIRFQAAQASQAPTWTMIDEDELEDEEFLDDEEDDDFLEDDEDDDFLEDDDEDEDDEDYLDDDEDDDEEFLDDEDEDI